MGDDSPWIARVAGVVAEGAPSVTVLLNGGDIAHQDGAYSVAVGGWRVLLVGGSGRTADALAAALVRWTALAHAVRVALTPFPAA